MKLSDLNLKYVKEYLRVEHDLDDNRIRGHMDAVINYILRANGHSELTDEFASKNTYLTDIVLSMIETMYDTGELPTSKYLYQAMTMDREF